MVYFQETYDTIKITSFKHQWWRKTTSQFTSGIIDTLHLLTIIHICHWNAFQALPPDFDGMFLAKINVFVNLLISKVQTGFFFIVKLGGGVVILNTSQ